MPLFGLTCQSFGDLRCVSTREPGVRVLLVNFARIGDPLIGTSAIANYEVQTLYSTRDNWKVSNVLHR